MMASTAFDFTVSNAEMPHHAQAANWRNYYMQMQYAAAANTQRMRKMESEGQIPQNLVLPKTENGIGQNFTAENLKSEPDLHSISGNCHQFGYPNPMSNPQAAAMIAAAAAQQQNAANMYGQGQAHPYYAEAAAISMMNRFVGSNSYQLVNPYMTAPGLYYDINENTSDA